jgi:hypothetical protein
LPRRVIEAAGRAGFVRCAAQRHISIVMTDNAADLKKAKEWLQEWILGPERARCAVHGIDLFFNDVGRVAEVTEILAVTDFVRWIHSHRQLENIVKQQQKEGRWISVHHEPPGVLVPIEMRFASAFAMLRRFC